jgi:hypothetical protein
MEVTSMPLRFVDALLLLLLAGEKSVPAVQLNHFFRNTGAHTGCAQQFWFL